MHLNRTFDSIQDVKATAEEPFVHLHDGHATRSGWNTAKKLMAQMGNRSVHCFFGMSHSSTWSQTNDLGVNYAVTKIHRFIISH
jgi:hypothetical protein